MNETVSSHVSFDSRNGGHHEWHILHPHGTKDRAGGERHRLIDRTGPRVIRKVVHMVAVLLQNLHKGVLRDEELYAAKLEEQRSGI